MVRHNLLLSAPLVWMVSIAISWPDYSVSGSFWVGVAVYSPGLLQSLFCRLRRRGEEEQVGTPHPPQGGCRPLDPRLADVIPDFSTALVDVQGFSVFLSSDSCRRHSRPTGCRAKGERCRQRRDAALPAPLSLCEQGFALRA